MDRFWLLSSTFYGNWLPGDPRGFVARVRDTRPDEPATAARHEHDMFASPYDADMPGLYRSAQEVMKGPPVHINLEQAEALLGQFQETAVIRTWTLLAVAIMANHVHIVVGVLGDPQPRKVLGDFKAYGSRVLNQRWGRPPSDTWWTYKGSKRKLPDERAVRAAIAYVRSQQHSLIIWVAPGW